MKFCFFSAQYLPTVGGVERYTYSLACQLIKKGHEVMVVTSLLPGLPAREVDENGIEVFRLPAYLFMGGRFPVVKFSKERREFNKIFKEKSPDFCLIQTHFYVNSLYGAALAKKHNIPAIVVEHGTAHLMRNGLVGALGSAYEHFAATFLRAKGADFYGVSKACCSWLGHFKIKTDKVLYNSVDIQAIEKIQKANRKDYSVNENTVLIVFAARLIEEKGILKLIDAFKMLKQEDIKLVIAGDGPLYDKVKNLETEKISVVGPLSYTDVIALYKAADIFCLPTAYPEGFPTTVLEAAGCKTVIIATDKGGTGEILLNENFGLLLENNLVENLYKALDKAISMPQWRQTAAQNAYDRLNKYFTWDAVSDELIRIARGEK